MKRFVQFSISIFIMIIRKQFHIYPTKAQAQVLRQWTGCTRFVWNYMLKLNIELYTETGKFKFEFDMNNLLPDLKKHKDFLKAVPSQSLQQKCSDLSKALKNCVSKKRQKRFGFPRFKSRKTDTSGIRFPSFRIVDNKLMLPKMSKGIKIKLHQPLEGFKTTSATVFVDATDKWFVSIVADDMLPEPTKPTTIENAVGIDLGVNELLTTSDGEVISNPKWLRTAEHKLALEQRRLSRKVKGSNNRSKQRKRLAIAHQKVRNKRKDFINKVISAITKQNDLVVLEDLNVEGMKHNHKLAKSISDASFGMIRKAFEWQCRKRGKHFVLVDRFFPSSKLCSKCGHKHDMPLDVRTFECHECGMVLDRDVNASINILNEGLKTFLGH